MSPLRHALVGAGAALVPDLCLGLFVWRADWLPRSHPLVRAHAWLHGPGGFGVAVALGVASHLVADHYSTHRLAPGVEGRRPWRW